MPPGWDDNPSSWRQRIPIVAVALVGFVIATYLALYQWGVIRSVWEPFFGGGSRRILNSRISHLLPVPDAALGAFGYLLDAVAGVVGGPGRWRRMPWIVIVFGIAVGPLGVASVLLVILQPVMFDAFLHLVSGFCRRVDRDDRSGHGRSARQLPAHEEPEGARRIILAGLLEGRGAVSLGVVGGVLGGLWLMTAPAILGYAGSVASDIHRIAGPISVSLAVIAAWDVTRAVRWPNIGLGAMVIAAVAVVPHDASAAVAAVAGGLVLIAATPFGRKPSHRFGGGWRALVRS